MLLRRKHPIVKRMFKLFLDKKFEGTWINSIVQEDDMLKANIHLPEHKERADLEKLLPNLQQELGATAVKLGKVSGKNFEILFGMRELGVVKFNESLLHMDTLQLEFPSAYGKHILDFEDGASCHMLNGGVTRMGKTIFLLYLATTIFLQNRGNVKLYISSAKLKDYYPFDGIPDVTMTRDEQGFYNMLGEIIDEYKKRDALLYSPQFKKATDAKSIKELYPDSYDSFKPIFLIIDEYARFADSSRCQKLVTELVETAGFVNVHVIIASQRPDASTVLRPRIRANLLCRMAFTTADRKNSEVILDREGAEKLGKIAGRGMLVDSDSHVIQVPFMTAIECDNLLKPYQIGEIKNEQSAEGYVNQSVTDKIQSMLQKSDSLDDLSGECQSSERSEPSIKTDGDEWLYNTNQKGKR